VEPLPRPGSVPGERARRLEHVGGAEAEPRAAEVRLAGSRERVHRGERATRRARDRLSKTIREGLDAGGDLPDVRRGGADEGRERLPGILAEEPESEKREEAGEIGQLPGVLEMDSRILVEAEVAPDRRLARVAAEGLDREKAGRHRPHAELRGPDHAAPRALDRTPPERLSAGEGEVEVQGTGVGEVAPHGERFLRGVREVNRFPRRWFPLTLPETAWEDRLARTSRTC
jgi:hypothetical protein